MTTPAGGTADDGSAPATPVESEAPKADAAMAPGAPAPAAAPAAGGATETTPAKPKTRAPMQKPKSAPSRDSDPCAGGE